MASCTATITAWNSPAIAKLISEDPPFGVALTNSEASWIASVSFLTFMVGAIAAAPCLKKFGPKMTLLFIAFPIFISWIVIAFTKSVNVLIAMRCVSGVIDGFIVAILPLYLGEITDKDIRGGITTIFSIMISLGNIFVLSVGPFVSYTNLALSCATIPLLFVVIFISMPDSPYFLYKKGKIENCNRTLRRLLPRTTEETVIRDRMLEIELTIASGSKSQFSMKRALLNRNFLIGLFIVLGAKLLTHLCGKFVLKSYLQSIIQSSGSSISPEISSIIFGIVQLPSVLLSAYLVDRMGRKPLYIISSAGSGIALITEGIYFYLEQVSPEFLYGLTWLPTVFLTIYLVLASIGLNSIQFTLLSEIFSSNVKYVASSICTSFAAPLAFALTKLFLPLSQEWGIHTIFWIFGFFCFLATLFGIHVIPETKGKSFLEIQEMLQTISFC